MPLTSTQSVAQLLKKETCAEHQQTERILAPKLASIKCFEDYARILEMFYGFFHPLEKRVRKYLDSIVLNDIDERRNSLLILEDLRSLNRSTEEILLCDDLPVLKSVPQALGAMYVLEGSTLGGRVICKMLLKNESCLFSQDHLRFFSGYHEQTGEKWTSFVSTINRYDDAIDEMTRAANETFNSLTTWMQQRL